MTWHPIANNDPCFLPNYVAPPLAFLAAKGLLAMVAREELHARIRAATREKPASFLVSELMSFSASDFPAGERFIVTADISVAQPSVSGPWSISDGGLFVVDIFQGIRADSDWGVSVSPELYSRIEQIAIQKRAKVFGDVEYISGGANTHPGMRCTVQFKIFPPGDWFLLAYQHAFNVRQSIRDICYKAAAIQFLVLHGI